MTEITEEALRTLVDAFYDRVRQDALIGPFFDDAIEDWPEHLDKLQAFSAALSIRSKCG